VCDFRAGEKGNEPGGNFAEEKTEESGQGQHWYKAEAVVQMDMEVEEEVQDMGGHQGDTPDSNAEEQLSGDSERSGGHMENVDQLAMLHAAYMM
jgi:hypothetical protein